MKTSLPSPFQTHWSYKTKNKIVDAINDRLISEDDACTIYKISKEEIRSWLDRAKQFGEQGLMATKIQRYR